MYWIVIGAIVVVVSILVYGRRWRKSSGLGVGQLSKGTGVPAAIDRSLANTRSTLGAKLGRFFGQKSRLTSEDEAVLQEALLAADVGVKITHELIRRVQERLATASKTQTGRLNFREVLIEEAVRLFPQVSPGLKRVTGNGRPYVISIVGVNGVGKTTTVGKLSAHFSNLGQRVLVGAADTFRAAAVSQLRVWAERSGAQIVSGREGSDPGAVVFDALTAAKARDVDVVLLDTAGRLHTRGSLMEELKKIHRVMKKVISDAPHEVFLVLDATLGQNSLAQAKQFAADLGVSGIIVTKLDGTAKGGAVLGICGELGVPVRFLGVGEAVDDLVPFESHKFVQALVGAG